MTTIESDKSSSNWQTHESISHLKCSRSITLIDALDVLFILAKCDEIGEMRQWSSTTGIIGTTWIMPNWQWTGEPQDSSWTIGKFWFWTEKTQIRASLNHFHQQNTQIWKIFAQNSHKNIIWPVTFHVFM